MSPRSCPPALACAAAIYPALALAAWPSAASAHVCMEVPVSRAGPDCSAASPQKVGPCGINQRGDVVTAFRPGETITVTLNETIDHPSHYRVAFSLAGDQFDDPTRTDEPAGDGRYVLRDDIIDEPAARQDVEVILPDVTCEQCTLQLIQVMYDRLDPGELPTAGDLYFGCADIALREDAAPTSAPGADAGAPEAARDAATAQEGAADDDDDGQMGSCSVSQSGKQLPGLAHLLAAGALVALCARRRGRTARERT